MFFHACLFVASSLSLYSSWLNHCSTMLWLSFATCLQVSLRSTLLAPTSCLVRVSVSLTESSSVWRVWTVGEQLLFFLLKMWLKCVKSSLLMLFFMFYLCVNQKEVLSCWSELSGFSFWKFIIVVRKSVEHLEYISSAVVGKSSKNFFLIASVFGFCLPTRDSVSRMLSSSFF